MDTFRPPEVADELEAVEVDEVVQPSPPFKFKSAPPIRNPVPDQFKLAQTQSILVERSKTSHESVYNSMEGPEYLKPLPAAIDYSIHLSSVSNTPGINSLCYAGAAMMEFHAGKKMSAGWIARHHEGPMDAQQMMEILYQHGCPYESEYPSDLVVGMARLKGLGRLTSKPNAQQAHEIKKYAEAQATAETYRIAPYARIPYQLGKTTDNIGVLQRSLFENGPAVMTLPVYNYGGQPWKPDAPTSRQLGGIGMTLVGYNHAGFILRGCWGVGWGNAGYTILTYDDFLTRVVWDVYTIVLDVEHTWTPDGMPASQTNKAGCCSIN